jgi:phospholipase C
MQAMGAALVGASACADESAGAGGTEGSSGSSDSGTSGGPTSGSPSTTLADTSATSADDTSSGTTDVDASSSEGSSSDTTTGGPVDACTDDGGLTPAELLSETDIIVVLMMENRSFDHYFGSATFLENWQVDGLAGDESNPDLAGDPVSVFAMGNLEVADPPHSWDEVHAQWNDGAMDGFVTQHQMLEPASHTEVMGYYVRDQLPISYALAEGYTVCDRWFCSVLGPTWPNRFYLHSASSNGGQSNLPAFGLQNIWGVLDEQNITARNYYHDVPWVWGGYANPLVNYTDTIDDFFAAAEVGTLPQYVVIDPNFGLLGGGEGQNDDHPDANVTMGQILIAAIHEALAQSPQWSRILFVITYDEHGGFYDHVAPPETVDGEPEFRRLGVRVPSIVCGPQVRRGCVNSNQFEHVSVISTLTTRHGLAAMNDRVTATADLSSCINPAYLQDPQPPVALPKIRARLQDLLATAGPKTSHPELREMIANGSIPIPTHRRHANASRDISMSLIRNAQRLGVLELID